MKDINLLIEEDKNLPLGETVKAKPVKTVGKITVTVLVLAIATVTIAAPKLYAETLNMQLASIQNQLKADKYKEVESVKSQLAVAGQQLDDKKSVIRCIDEQAIPVNEILNAVRNNTPKGCAINDIQYDSNTLRLSVKVQEISNVAEFLLNMDRLNNIKLSENSNNIKINTNGEYVFNFDVGQKGGK